MAHLERVIVLVDMDCFYCQVEEKLDPTIRGKPIAVVQYNAWRGGGIIAVNYPARKRGVTRHMRGDEAQKNCPDIVLCKVPCVRGKADLTKYREAGKEVAAVLQKYSDILQRASIDEAYLDITQSVNKRIEDLQREVTADDIPATYVYGADKNDFLYDLYNNSTDNEANLKLMVGAIIVEEIRKAVFEETGYECSAGIAHNKILSKLACGFNKPNKQTVLPHVNVPVLYEELPIHKIKSLGGKFGEALAEDFNITNMSELGKISEKSLQEKYDTKMGTWLYNIAKGIDMEPVTVRLCPKSIGCCKRFPGANSLNTPQDVEHWIGELANEVSERLHQDLAEYNRRASQMIVSYTIKLDNKKATTCSKTRSLVSYDHSKIASDAFEIVHKVNSVSNDRYVNKITYLGISAGKFVATTQNISQFFNKSPKKEKLAVDTDTQSVSKSAKTEGIQSFFQNANKNSFVSQENSSLFTDIQSESLQDDSKLPEKPKTIDEESLNDTQLNNSNRNDSIKSFFQNTSKNSLNQAKTRNFADNENLDSKPLGNEPTSSFFSNKLRNKVTNQMVSNSEKLVETESETVEQTSVENISDMDNSNEENMEICPDCNKIISREEFSSHCDYHIALKLAAEDKSPVVVPSNGSINKFFSKSMSVNEVDNQQCEICDQCKQKIPLDQFLDHLDYHAAKKLHAELNKSEVKPKLNPNVSSQSNQKTKLKPTETNKKNKLKRQSNSSSKTNSKKLKTISSFFNTVS